MQDFPLFPEERRFQFHSTNYLLQKDNSLCSFYRYCRTPTYNIHRYAYLFIYLNILRYLMSFDQIMYQYNRNVDDSKPLGLEIDLGNLFIIHCNG